MQITALATVILALATTGLAAPHNQPRHGKNAARNNLRRQCKPRPKSTGAAPSSTGAAGGSAPAPASSAPPQLIASDSATTPSATQAAPESSSQDATPASSDSSASAAPTPTSGSTGGGGGGATNGSGPAKKAGLSSGEGIQNFVGKIGWNYDWSPNPQQVSGSIPVPMLWGDGSLGNDQLNQDGPRFAAFEALAPQSDIKFVMGFEEPDCAANGGTSGSSGLDVDTAAKIWDQQMKRFKDAGALLISPSMCKQSDETWLKEFQSKISIPWDITNVHINKPNRDGVFAVLEHYKSYGKPMWVSEFACVNDSPSWNPVEDIGQIKQYISDTVNALQAHPDVVAYAFSNGAGLGNTWKLVDYSGGPLSEAGKAYLDAVSQYA